MKRRLTKANEEMLAAIKESSERDLTSKRHRSCEDAAGKMEDVLFSVGGAERVVKTLQYFKDRAAVEELTRVRSAMEASDASENYLSKEERLSAIVMASVKDFLGMFTRKQGDVDKRGGRRKPEDQNAYDAVMSSLVSEELDAAKLTKMLSHKFGTNRRQLKRGRALGKNLKNMDSKCWIRKSSAVSRNAICSGTVTHFLCTSFSCAYFHACIDFFALQIIVQQYQSSCTPMNAVK